MTEILADTSILIDYLEDKLAAASEEALANTLPAISIITYFEIHKFFLKVGRASDWQQAKKKLESYAIIELNMAICDEAARCAMAYNLSMADSLIYASAKLHKLKLATSDKDHKNLPEVIYLKPKQNARK